MARIMRTTLLASLLAIAISGSASAQGWKEFAYPDAFFAVQLPAAPVKQTRTYTAPGGITVPATIYELRQPMVIYTMTIADLRNTPLDNERVIDQTAQALGNTGEVRTNVRAEINNQWGRELSIDEKDGSRSIFAIFYINHRLYELKGKVLPPNPERRSAFAIRFQQSLRFTVPRGGRG
jgi:hypothetical protein